MVIGITLMMMMMMMMMMMVTMMNEFNNFNEAFCYQLLVSPRYAAMQSESVLWTFYHPSFSLIT